MNTIIMYNNNYIISWQEQTHKSQQQIHIGGVLLALEHQTNHKSERKYKGNYQQLWSEKS